jgi:hypothetical protein
MAARMEPLAALDAWSDFFAAEAGAAAALSGLLFVALSINLVRILEAPHLPGRAAESLAMLVGALIVCSLGLVPGQPGTLLGGEYVAAGFVMWLFPTVNWLGGGRRYVPDRVWKRIVPPLMGQAATLPFVIGGALIMAGHWEGLYWLPPGVVFCFLASVLNAWVLLVEILR